MLFYGAPALLVRSVDSTPLSVTGHSNSEQATGGQKEIHWKESQSGDTDHTARTRRHRVRQ